VRFAVSAGGDGDICVAPGACPSGVAGAVKVACTCSVFTVGSACRSRGFAFGADEVVVAQAFRRLLARAAIVAKCAVWLFFVSRAISSLPPINTLTNPSYTGTVNASARTGRVGHIAFAIRTSIPFVACTCVRVWLASAFLRAVHAAFELVDCTVWHLPSGNAYTYTKGTGTIWRVTAARAELGAAVGGEVPSVTGANTSCYVACSFPRTGVSTVDLVSSWADFHRRWAP
jgi:hypothetical protein